MILPELILIGAGGHARSCIDIIEQQDQYRIAGLVGMVDELHTTNLGYPVIATDNDLPELVKNYRYALITVGQIQSPDIRRHLFEKAERFGFLLPTIIAPSAYVSRHATLGAGTIVMHGAIVNAGARVGDNCIINNRVLIEHDSVVEDTCHISTGSILNGAAHVCSGSFIGSGSIIREGVNIGIGCIVGMGSCVRHNQVDYSRIAGNSIT